MPYPDAGERDRAIKLLTRCAILLPAVFTAGMISGGKKSGKPLNPP